MSRQWTEDGHPGVKGQHVTGLVLDRRSIPVVVVRPEQPPSQERHLLRSPARGRTLVEVRSGRPILDEARKP